MKKIIGVILMAVLMLSSSVNVLASNGTEDFRITENTSLGDVMKNTDPETYYNYSEEQREQFDAINFIDLTENGQSTFEASDPDARSWYPTFGASLSTDQSSPSKGTLSYSGTISATEACPSLYLSAIAYDSGGSVVSEMANTRYGSSQVTVANIRYNLKSGGTYHVAYYGIIEAPAGLTPSSGVVSSTKYITLK